ncbi:DNA methylase [Pseudomonas sp. B2021]|uniref:DNA methyltransferase n=1 Tax=Pseudomonas sp. B2021 TaxID=2546445 RepID=UPI001BB0CD60|nr:DNA methyltransferase [Pseudomonas sp. B2021]MBR7215665.1 DNA methylase [Pseudomonas sp. B2021]
MKRLFPSNRSRHARLASPMDTNCSIPSIKQVKMHVEAIPGPRNALCILGYSLLLLASHARAIGAKMGSFELLERLIVIEIMNPKQNASKSNQKEGRLFPYYAGYSEQFAESIIDKLSLPSGSLILDPWNGSGTTSVASYKKGHRTVGIDLNPVMVLVAKASFVSKLDIPSLLPLAHSLVKSVPRAISKTVCLEPLEKWFDPQSAFYLRSIESKINKLLVADSAYLNLTIRDNNSSVSPIAAFFYVVLFRLARRLVKDLVGTNPTWLKVPKDAGSRKTIKLSTVKFMFVQEVSLLCEQDRFFSSPDASRVEVQMGDATNLELECDSVDAIITSPPYCTRIDYAVATSLELALLRMTVDDYKVLRRSLVGTSTVDPSVPIPESGWGAECISFLDKVRNHTSYASKTYYYKSHVQYYNALYKSIGEASRVCRPGADLVFVVQNSYYKEVLNDLALIVEEMGSYFNLETQQRCDFSNNRSMSDINTNSKKYSKARRTEESVLIFKKL